jgi:hypothetical protein
MKNLEEINKEFQKFKAISFPENSSNNEILSDLFFELVQFDSYIAGAVDKIIARKKVNVEEIQFDEAVENKLNDFINKSNIPGDIDLARKYLKYLYDIRKLIDFVKKDGNGSD